jgi:enoyl-CoA hydratase
MNHNDFFELSHDGAIANLTLNRPERMNTMAPAFFPAMRDAVRELDDAGTTRVLVISSTGKHFSAGMSLEVFAGDGLQVATTTARQRLGHRWTR